MQTAFDLTREAWIPVVTDDGEPIEVSLRTALSEAHRIRRLSCELPTQDFAILRLLLAVLHRAIDGPKNSDVWADLWDDDQLPGQAIDAYLDRYAHRFDLLHPTTPFYQVATLRPAKADADDDVDLRKLITDVPDRFPTGAMRRFTGLDAITYADAARWLVHAHAFDASGIKTPMEGTTHPVQAGKIYPSGAAWAATTGPVYLAGANLRETLLLNLIPADQCQYNTAADLPVWEKPHPDVTHSITPLTGKVDLYTCQERRIRLVHDGSAVTGALITYGDVRDATDHHNIDPLTAWKVTPDRGIRPVIHWRDSDHWRGLTSLLKHDDAIPPAVLSHVASLVEDGYLSDRYIARTFTVGLKFDAQRGKVQGSVADAFDLPARIVQDPELVARVLDAAAAADAAVAAYARAVLHLAKAAGLKPDRDTETKTGAYTDARADAYTRLRRVFMTWLRTVGTPGEQPVTTAYAAEIRRMWNTASAQAPPTVIAGRQTIGPDGTRHTFCEALAAQGLNAALARLTAPTTEGDL